MRPLPEDHPNFPNAADFAATMGLPDQPPPPAAPAGIPLRQMRWDVDNDGDGIPDSIWIDIGLPIQTDASGRRYRPLVAILCQDLDGRLNLNAHGSNEHRRDRYADPASGLLWDTPWQSPPPPPPGPFAGGLPRSLPNLSRGLGYGAADIYLGHLFAPNSLEFFGLFNERYRDTIRSSAGFSNIDDWHSMIKSLGTPADYNSQYSAYGSPPDLWGRGALALDYNGQPLPYYMGESDETLGDPYEQVLTRNPAGNATGPPDAPFTLAEMERLLRADDFDAASLPDRLVRTAPNTFGGPTPAARQNRASVTTHSSYLPVITGMVPQEYRSALSGRTTHSILDLYAARLTAGGVASANLAGQMLNIVPWEIWHGQRMNLNRWLGNRRDDSVPTNGVVDEPAEADAREVIWPAATPGGFGANPGAAPFVGIGVPFNYGNDAAAGLTSRRYAPQIYARQLYCLMWLLSGLSDYDHPTEEGTDEADLTAHRLAQWAINVVDFCDADAIMTPFEYDRYPFNNNGWQQNIDGDPATNEGFDRRIVWGAEYPDLLLTETLAFHDRRVRDTNNDRGVTPAYRQPSGTTPSDDDLDQYRIPQGSLFLELYCTRNQSSNNSRFPQELYDQNGRLDLGRLAPENPATGVRAPVWRVVISVPSDQMDFTDSPLERSKRLDTYGRPDTTSFHPDNMDLADAQTGLPPTDRIPPERYVWFAPQTPVVPLNMRNTFYSRNFNLGADPGPNQPRRSNVLLAPGSYAVVGPRLHTRVASIDDNDPTTFYDPSDQRISMAGNTFNMLNKDDTNSYATLVGRIRTPLGIICAAIPPNRPDWNNAPVALRAPGIGLSVSEPLPQNNYYEVPTFVFDTAPPALPDGYDEPDPSFRTNLFPDRPFDDIAGRPLADPTLDMQETGTTFDYESAFLQRLANPLEAYDPLGNPYITVDWATIDLTVFNGEDERDPSSWTGGAGDPFDPSDDANPQNAVAFSTRQRGGSATFAAPAPEPPFLPRYASNADYILWSPDSEPPFLTTPVPLPPPIQEYFSHNLIHSLGYLNGTMGEPLPLTVVAAAPNYLGSPQQPFPWLTWNNRPFANPMELMQVPYSTPSRLLHEFAVVPSTSDPYASSATPDYLQFRGTFRHLFNFLHSSNSTVTTGANFYRIFDHVETPSPFVGTEEWYNPVRTAVVTDPDADSFRPPYNYLSRFRDPGRVNINTIFERDVWVGIAKGFPALDPDALGAIMYDRILESRRGYSGLPLVLNSDYPTLFGNPFRPADSADLMPNNVGTAPNLLRKTEPVQASLLREDLLSSRTEPVFVPDAGVVPTALDAHKNQSRNPYFRYQGVARLSNLVSFNSNVFATWITVGYFEVEPNPFGVDAAHPDGFRLSRELGSDTGTVKRHRAFYIIDRSIPVAFEPGQNHNVDRAIKLRRFIE